MTNRNILYKLIFIVAYYSLFSVTTIHAVGLKKTIYGYECPFPGSIFGIVMQSEDKEINNHIDYINQNIIPLLTSITNSGPNALISMRCMEYLSSQRARLDEITAEMKPKLRDQDARCLYILANITNYFIEIFGCEQCHRRAEGYLKNIIDVRVVTGDKIAKLSYNQAAAIWYQALAILYLEDNPLSEKSIPLLEKNIRIILLINCLDMMRHFSDNSYGDYIFCRVNELVVKLDFYPTDDLNDLFTTLNSFVPEELRNHGGIRNKLRADFVKKRLKHQDISKYESNDFLAAKLGLRIVSTPASHFFNKQQKIQITVDKAMIRKFAAHIDAPTRPILEPTIENITEEDQQLCNALLREILYEKGFCNREGMWIEQKYVDGNKEEFDSAIEVYKKRVTKALGKDIRFNETDFDKIKISLKQMDLIRKKLAKANTITALSLAYKCLVTTEFGLPAEKLMGIQEAVHNCLQVAYEAKEINKLYKTKQIEIIRRNKLYYELARQMVNHLSSKKCKFGLLIPVGVPIMEGKSRSTHTIYVAIKIINNSTDNPQPIKEVQIIITNGGDYCKEFHRFAKDQTKRGMESYHYTAFKPFILDENRRAHLRNYIYRIISLKYESGDSYKLLRNVYLCGCRDSGLDKEGFTYLDPDTNAPITDDKSFTRANLEQTFPLQYTANCVIHNLLYAIKIMFDLNNDIVLSNNLVIGLDKFYSIYFNKEESPEEYEKSWQEQRRLSDQIALPIKRWLEARKGCLDGENAEIEKILQAAWQR